MHEGRFQLERGMLWIDLPEQRQIAGKRRPGERAALNAYFSWVVVFGLRLPCAEVTKRPEIALRYAPPVLPLLPLASWTVVLGLRFPCAEVT